jgi:AraC-like DNA-binding protein
MKLQTHGARKYPTSVLLKSSAGLGWSTISAELRSHSEMTDETSAGRMFVETASLTLAARLLHKYGHRGISALSPLASHKLDHARLRRVLDYIAVHLADDVTVSDLAGVAGLSVFHFARMFTLAVGVSPHRYVSRMRLERAMAEIAEGKLPLSKIAFDARFSSQASFTRAFRRATEMTPGEYRRARRGQTMRLKGRLESAHPAPLAPIWIETSESDDPVSTAKAVKTMAGEGQTRATAAP